MADAEIIWDDPPAETTRRTGRNQVREQAAGAGPAPTEEGEPFWEEDVTRAVAARSADTSERQQEPRDLAGRAAAGNTRPVPKRRPATAAGARRIKPEKSAAIAQIEVATRRKMPSRLALVLMLVPLLVITAAAWTLPAKPNAGISIDR